MDRTPLLIDETPALDQNMLQTVVCPACHTRHPSLTREGLAAGAGWTCTRCAQKWDARSLAAVAEYRAWVAAREAPVTAGAAP